MIEFLMKGIIGFTEWLFESLLKFLNYCAKSQFLSILVIVFIALWIMS